MNTKSTRKWLVGFMLFIFIVRVGFTPTRVTVRDEHVARESMLQSEKKKISISRRENQEERVDVDVDAKENHDVDAIEKHALETTEEILA